jgi:hypothetical protein
MPLLVVTAITLLGLAVVGWALLHDEDLTDDEGPGLPADWGLLPDRSDLARMEFGLRVPGYDPATVDAAFDALAAVYADLLDCADEATRRRARRRIAQRLGREADLVPATADGPTRALPTHAHATNEEALLAAAALDVIARGGR